MAGLAFLATAGFFFGDALVLAAGFFVFVAADFLGADAFFFWAAGLGFFAFLAVFLVADDFFIDDFFPPPKIFSHPSANFWVEPTRTTLIATFLAPVIVAGLSEAEDFC
jgi:hypothetical protein